MNRANPDRHLRKSLGNKAWKPYALFRDSLNSLLLYFGKLCEEVVSQEIFSFRHATYVDFVLPRCKQCLEIGGEDEQLSLPD